MKQEMQWRGVKYTVEKPTKKAKAKTSSKAKTVIKYRGSELEV